MFGRSVNQIGAAINKRDKAAAKKEISEREQFLSSVIITAVEGGIGYWSQVSKYDHGGDDDGQQVRKATVTVHEDQREEGGEVNEDGVAVTTRSIASAIARILDKDSKISLHVSIVRAIRNASAENDCCNLDSGDCDCIMQVAVLGEVVYG